MGWEKFNFFHVLAVFIPLGVKAIIAVRFELKSKSGNTRNKVFPGVILFLYFLLIFFFVFYSWIKTVKYCKKKDSHERSNSEAQQDNSGPVNGQTQRPVDQNQHENSAQRVQGNLRQNRVIEQEEVGPALVNQSSQNQAEELGGNQNQTQGQENTETNSTEAQIEARILVKEEEELKVVVSILINFFLASIIVLFTLVPIMGPSYDFSITFLLIIVSNILNIGLKFNKKKKKKDICEKVFFWICLVEWLLAHLLPLIPLRNMQFDNSSTKEKDHSEKKIQILRIALTFYTIFYISLFFYLLCLKINEDPKKKEEREETRNQGSQDPRQVIQESERTPFTGTAGRQVVNINAELGESKESEEEEKESKGSQDESQASSKKYQSQKSHKKDNESSKSSKKKKVPKGKSKKDKKNNPFKFEHSDEEEEKRRQL